MLASSHGIARAAGPPQKRRIHFLMLAALKPETSNFRRTKYSNDWMDRVRIFHAILQNSV